MVNKLHDVTRRAMCAKKKGGKRHDLGVPEFASGHAVTSCGVLRKHNGCNGSFADLVGNFLGIMGVRAWRA